MTERATTDSATDRPTASQTATCDVAVVGGGPAGIAAALAASACGATTILIERCERLGGNVSQAFVHTICGLYLPSAAHEAVYAHPGLPSAFATRLLAGGGAGEIGWAGSAGYLQTDPLAFAALAGQQCEQSRGLQVCTGAELRAVGLARQSDDPSQLELSGSGGKTLVQARAVVDASGDAAVAALGGAPTQRADAADLQLASFIFRMDGTDCAALDAIANARTGAAVAHASQNGDLPREARSIALRNGVSRNCVWVTLNLSKADPARFDPLDPGVLAELEARARETAAAVADFLIRERPGFSGARLGALPRSVGIRETRQVVGLARMEVDDVMDGRRRDDEACLSTWPVELWQRQERLIFRAGAGPCSVPLGALIADHPGGRLAMAGRCASASHEALGAIRVIGTSMAMGEAAGIACALAVREKRSLRDVAASEVRDVILAGQSSVAVSKTLR